MKYGYTSYKHTSRYFHENSSKQLNIAHNWNRVPAKTCIWASTTQTRHMLSVCCQLTTDHLKLMSQGVTECWHILIRNSPRQRSKPGTLMSGIADSLSTHVRMVGSADHSAGQCRSISGGERQGRLKLRNGVPRHTMLALRCYHGRQEGRQVSNSGENNEPHHKTETSDFRSEDKAEGEIKNKAFPRIVCMLCIWILYVIYIYIYLYIYI